jgi:transcriptional regulator with XRE-family HTH domain
MTYYVNQHMPLIRGTTPLATVATGTGLSRGYLSDLESGKKAASKATLRKLASYFGIDPTKLTDQAENVISIALDRVTDEWAKDVFRPYVHSIASKFQKDCLYQDAGLSSPFMWFVESLGFKIDMETAKSENPTEHIDEYNGLRLLIHEQLTSVSLNKKKHRQQLDLDTIKAIQQDTRKYVLFLLQYHAEEQGQRTRLTSPKAE